MNRLLAAALLLACFAPLQAAAPTLRTDLYGDPLPLGAVARIGTIRLRHAGLRAFACLPDGATVLTVGNDRTVRYWNLDTGRQVRQVVVPGLGTATPFMAFSPDGKTLTTLERETLASWDVGTGNRLRSAPAPKLARAYTTLSPDGNTLAIGTHDRHVVLCDLRTGRHREVALPEAPHHHGGASLRDHSPHGAFSPDGRLFAAGTTAAEPLTVYDLVSGHALQKHRLTCWPVASAFSPDGKTLAVASCKNDGGGTETVLRYFDPESGKQLRQHPLGTADRYRSLAYSPDGKAVLLSRANDLRVVDATSGRTRHRIDARHDHAAFTKDGKRVLASTGTRLRCWDATTGVERHDRPGDVLWHPAGATTPDGRLTATADLWCETVSVWETATGRLVRRLAVRGTRQYVINPAFAEDGRALFATQTGGLVQSWDVATWAERPPVQLLDDTPNGARPAYVYRMHGTSVGRTASTLALHSTTEGQSTLLGLYDLASGRRLAGHVVPRHHPDGAWSRDGKTFAYFQPRGLRLLSLETGSVRGQAPRRPVRLLTMSDDGRLLAGAEPGNGVVVWEDATGTDLATLPADDVAHLALVPGSRFAVTVDGSRLRGWDLATATECRGSPLQWHFPGTREVTSVKSLGVTADGRRAVTFLDDGSALIWDLTRLLDRGPRGGTPPREQLARWWADLVGDDPAKAYAAGWRFSDVPERDAVAFFRRHLRPAGADAVKAGMQHIEDLDSDTFAAREKATAALMALGRAAVPAVKTALGRAPSPERKQRLDHVLEHVAGLPASPEELRAARALLVLEGFASKDARGLLQELAAGAPHAPLTVAATAALRRWERNRLAR